MAGIDSRWLAGIAAIAAAFVILNELLYRGRSTLSPVLVALAIGILALAIAHFIRHRTP